MNTYFSRVCMLACPALLFLVTALPAQTILRDTLRNAVLEKTGNPYYLVGTVYVEESMIIEPGVVLMGKNPANTTRDEGTLYLISGYISAHGRKNDTILFDAVNVLIPDLPWWHTEGSYFAYCHFTNYNTIYGMSSLFISDGDRVENSSFTNNYGAIHVRTWGAAGAVILECIIENNIGGIGCFAYYGYNLIQDCIIRNNYTGIGIQYDKVRIQNCEIADNENIGVNVTMDDQSPQIGGAPQYCNRIYNNGINLKCNTPYQWADTVIASYNYWGSTDTTLIFSTFVEQWEWIHAGYLPIMDANCQPVTVGVERTPPPASFEIHVYPNPLTVGQEMSITYTLPPALSEEVVQITITDILGRRIRRIERLAEPGIHTVSVSTTGLTPGLYFYELKTPRGTAHGSMMLTK